MHKIYFLNLVFFLLLTSCTEKIIEDPIKIAPDSKAIYISNEGTFGYNNASLSVYYPETDKLENKVFKKINGRGLGDVLQSIYHYDDKLYYVVNASSKIEISNANTFEEKGTITNITSPRYMHIIDNKAYISCWGDGGQIVVVDLKDNNIVKKIDVGNGPEKILSTKDNLIVCNSGGFTTDSTISIINLTTNNVIKTLKVGDVPSDVKFNSDSSYFYVLCKGKTIYDASWNVIGHTASKLVKILSSNFTIESKNTLFQQRHPSQLVYNNLEDKFFIGGGYGFQGIYNYELDQEKLDTNALIDKSFYGISADSKGNLYGFESTDFSSQGKMVIMDFQGNILKEAKVGIGPNGMTE